LASILPPSYFSTGATLAWRSAMPRLSARVTLVVVPVGFAAADNPPSIKETIDHGLAFLAKDNTAWKKTKQCSECHYAPEAIMRCDSVDDNAHGAVAAGFEREQ
jgi:hypothetical protein